MDRAGDLPFAVRDRGVYLPAADAVVVADLHLGRDATSRVELPLGERRRIAERLDALIEAFDPAEVVLAGDVLHDFSTVPEGAAAALEDLRERVGTAGAALTVVEGNHDAMLGSVAETVAKHRLEDGTVVHHGHETPEADAPRYVIGHDHPAISIEGRRRPCVLYGEAAYRGADVLCLPAFNDLAAGTEVNGLSRGDPHSPLLAEIGSFRPVVFDPESDETFAFPPLSGLREFL